jgi:predicted nucleic-acid-binding Zn-ribbon protein
MSYPNNASDYDSQGCPKCGNEQTEVDQISTAGSGLSKYFDIQNRNFTVISCTDCGYSELYKGQSSGNAADIFLG